MATSFPTNWHQTPKSAQSDGFAAWPKDFMLKLDRFFNLTNATPEQALARARIKAIIKRVKPEFAITQVTELMLQVGVYDN